MASSGIGFFGTVLATYCFPFIPRLEIYVVESYVLHSYSIPGWIRVYADTEIDTLARRTLLDGFAVDCYCFYSIAAEYMIG
jgi:hypothetical protein